ncbi:DUF6527 family protein [Bradyrhizobium sp. SZCCHNR1082]|uniref:DUF6527 family protein n=2 Tax=Bradyrhizobium TaxID=374 RepID=UPI002916FC95|nr:DUF6527 family protein [Bradyrhizobium sp. SZCCHNR1082]
MIRTRQLRHRFVETMPDSIDPGVLYLSMEYATATHRCCCGCGEEVVTPFSPAQWQMSFDGDAVSLHPSIGNWNLRCRSHYVISAGRVIEAPQWTKAQIEAGRRRDKEARTKYLTGTPVVAGVSVPGEKRGKPSWLDRLMARLKSVFTEL